MEQYETIFKLKFFYTKIICFLKVIYALIISGRMKRGDSILIHAGTGGVGQAAIILALHFELEIFVTVGTAEKREFIKTNFPQVKKK